MAQSDTQTLVLGLVVLAIVLALVYVVDPTFFGLLAKKDGFANLMTASSTGQIPNPGMFKNSGMKDVNNTVVTPQVAPPQPPKPQPPQPSKEHFGDLAEYNESSFGNSAQPAGCYPRDQLTPAELLPADQNSVWAQQNPMGPGSLKGKNFLSAGALLGVNTVGQSLRNANWQLRSEPPNPQMAVSIFNQSTIAPDVNRRPLEIN
jgi:hypothetical protein